MTWNPRLLLRESAFTAFAFTLALYVYYFTVFWGMADQWMDGELKRYMASGAAQIELLTAGILYGGSIAPINRLTELFGIRRRAFHHVVFLMTAMNLVSFAVVTAVIVVIVISSVMTGDELFRVFQAMSVRNAVSVFLFQIFVVWMINFSLEIQRVVGFDNLWRILTGRYRNPREENRVFLFMDLKDSTEIAEHLGHRRFSEFLQRCFQDLTQVALRFNASIYQYVGDEVVMSWPCPRPERASATSVRAFFFYEEMLLKHAAEYRTRFGFEPVFRGGIDVGAVMATEVGDVKREIVFHGDVLNTASRLLDLCKNRNEHLVTSDAVGHAAEDDPTIHTHWIETVALRGKQETVLAHALARAAENGERPPPLRGNAGLD